MGSAQHTKPSKKRWNGSHWQKFPTRPTPIRPPRLPNLQEKPIYSRQTVNKHLPPGVEPSAGCTACKSSLQFTNKEAKKYEVGTNIPGLPFKTKQSWAGNIAMPDTPTTKNASLHFWLWGKDDFRPGDDLIIWMNGGPGCSSLVGLGQEIGPFIFPPGEDQARPNAYSWTIAANVLFISQPVGVAFTTGTTNNTNEDQISQQFVTWLFHFFAVFPNLRFNRIWIAGESYVGRYAAYFLDAYRRNPAGKYLQGIKGGILFSPVVSDLTVQLDAVTYEFAKLNKNILRFKEEDLKIVKNESDTCHLTNFTYNYLTYPPQSRLPDPNPECLTFDLYLELARQHNSHFNMYNIEEPNMGLPGQPTALEKFFNRTDVQDYIHAPRQNFKICKQVFADENYDESEPPDRSPSFQKSILALMVEYSTNFTIMSGLLDGLVMSRGLELALQNLTWGGEQGFNYPPSGRVPLCDMEGNKRAFATFSERKLRYVAVPDAGHMIPMDEPSLSLNAALSMLGRGSLFC
ncbi:alpha/beta-hydrolase [Meira miltonrushii]|uniref:Alpha/beta-hydrolase n=1 Tax=Meira miltonrushii TaxID=1280837 RepID=A0A316V5Z0_9BASI|nr:alpha/beta-hydrolase [Meira miltonrushii]PWN32654.1 alpha/beta-hydrolase [Meira miltonrushii]